ncbi:MAG TPA: hypothetical protein VF707_18795 [Ardenticatenaceae bacterium]
MNVTPHARNLPRRLFDLGLGALLGAMATLLLTRREHARPEHATKPAAPAQDLKDAYWTREAYEAWLSDPALARPYPAVPIDSHN